MNYRLALVLGAVIALLNVSSAAAADPIYYCTRRVHGVTQTYYLYNVVGTPRCNNKKHKGPFLLADTSAQVSTPGATGAQGPLGPQGPQGPKGDTGPAGADALSGGKVSGILRSCHLEDTGVTDVKALTMEGGVVTNNKFREGFCVLRGTSFTFRYLFGTESETYGLGYNPSIINDDQAFTLYHVPAGSYTLDCDVESLCSYQVYNAGLETRGGYGRCYTPVKYQRISIPVTVAEGSTTDVSVVNLCDADGDGYRVDQNDCNDANGAVSPGNSYDYCDGIDNDCDGSTDEDCNL